MSTFLKLIEESLSPLLTKLDELFEFVQDIDEGRSNSGRQAAQGGWGVSETDIFQATMDEHLRIFPDLREKLSKFLEVKQDNPMVARYGKHDSPFTGPMVGFWHAHLRDDAILIYNLKNRAIQLVCIVSHAEMEGKREKKLLKRIIQYK